MPRDAAQPLHGHNVVLFALNVPGPVAAERLQQMGATVRKIEPLTGDPFASLSRPWYDALHAHVHVERADVRTPDGRALLDEWLASADVLITSFRPSSLRRLSLDPASVAARFPRVCQVAIVGESGARAEIAGHDLTYQAHAGLLGPPVMPTTLLADLAGAERAVSATLALLLSRSTAGTGGVTEIALADAVAGLALPAAYGLTTGSGLLSGAFPLYHLYPAALGWVAVAALEPHFAAALLDALGLSEATVKGLATVLATRTAAEWEQWAVERGLPVAAVKELGRR